MRKTVTLVLLMICTLGFSQSTKDSEGFGYNRRLIKTTQSFSPKDGFVPDKATAVAIAYAIAVPIYGKKTMASELPFRAELKDGIWTVLGTLNCKSCEGGTLVVQVEKVSGKILFLTHTM